MERGSSAKLAFLLSFSCCIFDCMFKWGRAGFERIGNIRKEGEWSMCLWAVCWEMWR
ncbi:hypothetical protein MTR67_020034 [Solanum verrucosum]|uniref:Uncharacterized protein n=1 Tax=Solanum verrucosum TaxID=315347 RepID=A0AAF0TP32_SOLVR|nr:hypothetical protein MTR67_020034 [Solanum verrucosum]